MMDMLKNDATHGATYSNPDSMATSRPRGIESEQSRENDSDPQIIVKSGFPLSVELIGAERRCQKWMFKVKFDISPMNRHFLERLHFGDRPALEFVESTYYSPDNRFHVEWKPLWTPNIPEDFEHFRHIFEVLVSSDDQLLWIAESSLCTINDEQPYHLCLDLACEKCQPIFRRGRAKEVAVEYFSIVLEGHFGEDLPQIPAVAEELFGIAIARDGNPFGRIFLSSPSRHEGLRNLAE